jgi:hypothetical protein
MMAVGLTSAVDMGYPAMLAEYVGICLVVLALLIRMGGEPRLRPHELAVEGGAVRLDASRAFPIADIAQGYWEDPDRANLVMKDGRVLVVQVESAAVGERLLRATGVAAAERVLRFPLASLASQVPGGTLLGGALVVAFGSAFAIALAAVVRTIRDPDYPLLGTFIQVTLLAILSVAVFVVTSALRRREAVVGTDGIAYKRTLRTGFIPYGALASVLLDKRGVRLVRKDGRRMLLRTRGWALGPPAEAQGRVLVERIRAAMMSTGTRTKPLAQAALDRLDRNGRSREAWREDLGRLLSNEGDYRRTRISPEALGAVIEDAAAPVERRVAAAVALAACEGEEARRRVRIAVRACADEDLQAALEAAAEGEIAEGSLARASSRSP